MDITKIVAWWGAGLSTAVFAWDIWKYRHAGPKLRFQVRTGVPSEDATVALASRIACGGKFIQTEVTNYGDRPTTLTNMELYYFDKPWSWARLRNRPTKEKVLNNPNPAQPFPCELKPGGVWRGRLMEQMPELVEWGTTGALYFELYHSHHTKPVRERVRFRL